MIKDPLVEKLRRTLIKIFTLKNWYKVVLPETKFSYTQEMFAKLRNGLVFHIKNSSFDLPILYQIFWNNIYDLSEIKKIDSPKILDIGGHIGMFSIYSAHNLKKAKIYSYEPDPFNIKLFKENLSLNHTISNIILTQTAICGERGRRKMFVNPTNTSMNNMYQKKESRGMKDFIEVECKTLSDIFDDNNIDKFDYAKIDSEGSEYETILNAKDSELEKLPYMIIEWHDNTTHTPDELVTFLNKKGYKTTFSRKPRIIVAKK